MGNDFLAEQPDLVFDEVLGHAGVVEPEQWAKFIRHVVADEPFPYDFRHGTKGVQLSELGYRSWSEGKRLAVPELEL